MSKTSDLVQVFHAERVLTEQGLMEAWIKVRQGKVSAVLSEAPKDTEITSFAHSVLMPGLVDSHVHINEPGRTEWEGFFTATQAAIAGGVTTVVDMPLNCIPVTTSVAALNAKIEALGDQLHADIGFWGGVIPNHEQDLKALTQAGILGAKAFMCHSGIDDFPASDRETLKQAMCVLKEAGAPLLLHAELESPVTESEHEASSYQSYLDSRPATWEVDAIALAIELMRETGCAVHIVHLSASEALPMITSAKAEGLPLSVETCPHYLCLSAEEIADKQTQFKCAPPIREHTNREALWKGLGQGIIDFIVSDHSPCTPELKCFESGDFHDAWGGISSLQLGLSNIWTEAHKRGYTLNQLGQWLCQRPAEFTGLGQRKGKIAPGYDADFVVWSPENSFVLEPADLRFKHKLSPYLGRSLHGQVTHTYLRGELVYHDGQVLAAQGRHILGRGE